MEPTLFNIDGGIQSRYSNRVLKLLPLLPGRQSFTYVLLSDIEIMLTSLASWNNHAVYP